MIYLWRTFKCLSKLADPKKIEELIMATRNELMETMKQLSETVSGEAGQIRIALAMKQIPETVSGKSEQIRTALDDLKEILAGLQKRVAELEVDEDFSSEVLALKTIQESIAGI